MSDKAEIILLAGIVIAIFALYVLLPVLIQRINARRIQAELDKLTHDIAALRHDASVAELDDCPGGSLRGGLSGTDMARKRR